MLLTIQAFWQEVQEQVPKMELIIVAGKRLVDDMDWMQDEREHHVMQQITQQYLCVERRWKQLLSRGQEWGGLLDNLYPEMKQCQVYVQKCFLNCMISIDLVNWLDLVSDYAFYLMF